MSQIDRRAALGLALGTLPWLAGCGGVLDARNAAPPAEYRLMPDPSLGTDLPKRDWVLIVAEPQAAGALDTDRMTLITQGRVDRIADVTWSERPAAMLQFAIVRAFQDSGRLRGVGTDRDDLPARFILQSTLDAFQLEPEGEGYAAQIDLDARLLRLPGRDVVGGKAFRQRVPAAERSNAAAAAAFNQAATALVEELVAWTLKTGGSR